MNLQNFFWIVFAKYTVSYTLSQNILCSYSHWILNFLQENVKSCTLISHFASASGGPSPRIPTRALPLDPTRGLASPIPTGHAPRRERWTPYIVKSWVRWVSLLIHRNQGSPTPATQNASWKSAGDKQIRKWGGRIYLFASRLTN